MPTIKSSTDLRNNYNSISTYCHESREPVFITKNGQGDLAVMSIEVYETLKGKLELYYLHEMGGTDVVVGHTHQHEDVKIGIKHKFVLPTLGEKEAPTGITTEKPKMSRAEMFGCMRGQFEMADDFDAPLDDFKEYM